MTRMTSGFGPTMRAGTRRDQTSADGVRRSLEDSLQRLGIDHIDALALREGSALGCSRQCPHALTTPSSRIRESAGKAPFNATANSSGQGLGNNTLSEEIS